MIKVLHVAACPFPSHQGTQRYVHGLCGALAQRGLGVTLACWAGGAGTTPTGVEIVRGASFVGSDRRRSGPHWTRAFQAWALTRVVRRVLRRGDIDLVHAHNVEAPVVAAWAGPRSIPILYGHHTTMAEELPSYFARGKRPAAWIGAAMDHGASRLCSGAVALSARGARDLHDAGVRPVLVVPPGVHGTELEGAQPGRARARWGLGPGPFVVYAGNLDGYQDLPDLVAAMVRLPEARLVVATGSNPAVAWRVAASAGLDPSRLVVAETRSWSETRDILSAASVAVVPRRRCSGFPMKLLNQLGLGIPTIAVAGGSPGLPGVVLVEPGPGNLARALGDLIADPVARDRLARAGREEIRVHWTWEARAEAIDRFYAAVLARAG